MLWRLQIIGTSLKKKKKKRNEENGKSTPMIEGTHLKFLIIYEKKKKNYY